MSHSLHSYPPFGLLTRPSYLNIAALIENAGVINGRYFYTH